MKKTTNWCNRDAFPGLRQRFYKGVSIIHDTSGKYFTPPFEILLDDAYRFKTEKEAVAHIDAVT